MLEIGVEDVIVHLIYQVLSLFIHFIFVGNVAHYVILVGSEINVNLLKVGNPGFSKRARKFIGLLLIKVLELLCVIINSLLPLWVLLKH